MRTVKTEEVITYGGSMLWYLLAVYVGGGVLALIGVVVIAMGTGQPTGTGNPLALVVGLFLILVAYALMIAGTIGIAHKLIADSVRKGLKNAGIAGSDLPDAPATETN